MSEKTKKLLLMNLPYLFVALFATKFGQAWRLAAGADASGKLLHLMDGLTAAFSSPLPSFYPTDLTVGVLIAAALRLAVYVKDRNAKKFRKNVEYSSARWGKDIKPNLMQCDSKDYPTSFVVTDPKGSIVVECGNLLRCRGYRIKILNTINFKKSMHYNLFAYIHFEKDILKLVTALITNTKGEGKAGDDFWGKAKTLLYTALIEFINASEVREDDEEFKNPVDLMFEALEKGKPNHFAVRQYKKYKLASSVICSK
jgi:type IV secretion system protein VirD4